MRRHTIVPLLLLAALTLACGGDGPRGEVPGRAPRGVSVRTGQVAARDVVYRVKALGSLEADELVQITAQVAGAASQVLFNAGDRVDPETVLVRIDPERYRLEAARASAAYRKALAESQRAEADMKRRETLAREKLVSEEELNGARLEAERLGAETAATRAAADIAQQNLERAEVRAPRAGKINTRAVDTGQFVQAGAVLATLVDTGRLRLRLRVSEQESLRTAPGQAIAFTVSAVGGQSFEAKVYHVADVADPATRQVEVLAWVANPGPLKPGFFAEAQLATEEHKGTVAVPEGAVQASDRGFVAYVVQEGKAKQRPVQLGLRTGDGAVEILSGLAAGETIVVEGSDRLADGVAVEVKGAR